VTRPIADLDVPLPVVEQQIRDEAARYEARLDAIADRWRAFLAPTPTTPEEGS